MPISLLALGAVLLVFGSIVGVMSWQLRGELREGVIQRSASIWAPLTRYQVNRALEDDLLGVLEVEDAILYSLLDTYDVDGAIGVYVYDANGVFLSGAPMMDGHPSLSSLDVKRARAGEAWGEIEYESIDGAEELALKMSIPLFSEDSELLATARYLMEGDAIEAEFEEIDRTLARQAGGAFLGGGAAIVLVFFILFSRLKKAGRDLEERAARLAEANAELAMVAKTSAVGAVASHLIHGLKNPLSGLRQHIASGGEGLEEEDWKFADEATGRMQRMINDVVDVLRSDALGEGDEVEVAELFDVLERGISEHASEKGIRLAIDSSGGILISERKMRIASLILENLANNGIEACPIGGELTVRGALEGDAYVIEVRDTGSGFSDAVRENLFSPTQSAKADGAGIGLAISQQLARHIGARLELVRSDASGSVMALSISFL